MTRKQLVARLLATSILLSALLLGAALSLGSTLSQLPPDPAGYGIGFTRAHVDKRGNVIVLYGNSHDPFGNNSVRSYNPGTKAWTYLWPNGTLNGGPQNRDNHASLYVPQLDEIWVWGGSGLENFSQPAIRSGRFSLATNKWVATSTTDGGAFAGVVRGQMPFFPNASMAWSEQANMGVIFGGSQEGNPIDLQYVIEPNPGGPEPYRISEYAGARPPNRTQAQNLMVAVGGDFYLHGGSSVNWDTGQYLQLRDLWKFSGASRTWTKLADGLASGYQSAVTHDSQLGKIVAWVDARLYIYDIATNRWADDTPAGLPCVFNQVGAYSPTGMIHFYEGGNDCATSNSTYMNVGVSLSSVAPTPTPTPPPPPAPPPSPIPSPGDFSLPLRTWVSRPIPDSIGDVRAQFIGQKGFGPSPNGTGSKHQRLVYVPETGRVYFYSGDYGGGAMKSSFRTDMFSYDIRLAEWRLEWPYCGLPGQISPANTDEAPFAWDSKRKVFWVTGGFESSTDDVVGACANGAIFYGNSASTGGNPQGNAAHGPDILQFDPLKNRFIRPDPKYRLPIDATAQDGSSLLGGTQMPRHSTYNPVTDEIIMIGRHGGWGNYVIRMSAETGRWARDGGDIGGDVAHDAIDGSYINDTQATHEQLALDVENQFVYWIDTARNWESDPNRRFRLMRYDIAKHAMASMGWIPLPDFGDPKKFPFYMTPRDSTMLAYDPINRVLLWPASSNEGRPILMIYHPDPAKGRNGRWETDAMVRDRPGEIVFGSNGTFVSELNALIIYGGFGTPNSDFFMDECPSCVAPQRYFWLDRYGEGRPATTVPPAPTNLTAK